MKGGKLALLLLLVVALEILLFKASDADALWGKRRRRDVAAAVMYAARLDPYSANGSTDGNKISISAAPPVSNNSISCFHLTLQFMFLLRLLFHLLVQHANRMKTNDSTFN